jgi:preprotein translocase subunit SecD
VTGADLEDVQESVDRVGQPAVGFTLTKQGGDRFHEMTSQNRPVEEDRARHLAIILDDLVMSSPALRSPIRESGQISGKFTPAEVANLVAILRSGALPLPLKPLPVSETTVEPASP